MKDIPSTVKRAIALALEEDIGNGDITSSLLIPAEQRSTSVLISKESFIVAGLNFVREVFLMVDQGIEFEAFVDEGSRVDKNAVIANATGCTRSLLAAERVALNILQHLSGIATLTNTYVNKVKDLKTIIVDTRKTKPCMRYMEKYAVKMGGGTNHRFGLYDGILIKDNHIEAVQSIARAIELSRKARLMSKIEVEVENLKDFAEALEAGADIIMLDNMSLDDMREAVNICKGRALLEASGNVNLDNVREIAETGVDVISIGALTHSAPAADISMKLMRVEGEENEEGEDKALW